MALLATILAKVNFSSTSRLQALVVGLQFFALGDVVEPQQDLIFTLKRLGNEINRPEPGRFHDILHFAVGGDDQDAGLDIPFAQIFQQGHAVHHRHADIGDDVIKKALLGPLQALFAIARHYHLVTIALQHSRQ